MFDWLKQLFHRSHRPTRKPARPRTLLKLEVLEDRLVPAMLLDPHTVLYRDVDGDWVHVQFSKDVLNATNVKQAFTFNGVKGLSGDYFSNEQLDQIDLSAFQGINADNLDIQVTVALKDASGDGLVNVGSIRGGGKKVNSITVQGVLGNFTGELDVGTINVNGLGYFSGNTASLSSNGTFDRLSVATDMTSAYISVMSTYYRREDIFVGGSVTDSRISGATIGNVEIGGNLNGGLILGANSIGNVLIHGSVSGGDTDYSGSILAGISPYNTYTNLNSHIGSVTVQGDLIGGLGTGSGSILCGGSIAWVQIGGSVVGGSQARTGEIYAGGSIGWVQIAGSMTGGAGGDSGSIQAGGTLDHVYIDGSLLGGTGGNAGWIVAGELHTVVIGGDMTGLDPDHRVGIISRTTVYGYDEPQTSILRVIGSVQYAEVFTAYNHIVSYSGMTYSYLSLNVQVYDEVFSDFAAWF